ncbi:hypothetical protein TNCV_1847771 [Trichonephila clavipes]|nr:hypothetical protein TNCV_1847771 [Trichonephila clavipes]
MARIGQQKMFCVPSGQRQATHFCSDSPEPLEAWLFNAEIVEVEIGGVTIYRPFGEFRRAKSYCHLYGAQGQRQAYF